MIIFGMPGMSLIASKGSVRRHSAGERFWHRGGAFTQCLIPAQLAGGSGVNISKGQQVWLCWDLEPAADVVLCSGCFLLEWGGGGGISTKPFGLLCR